MSTLGEAFSSSSLSSSGSSHRNKSAGRKNAKPATLERTNSVILLPSPPDEFQQGPRKPSFICLNDEELQDGELTDVEENEQVDMLASSSPEFNDERDHVNERESNPFLVPAQRRYKRQNSERLHDLGPSHPQSSPTHQKKRKIEHESKNRLEIAQKASRESGAVSGGKVTGWDSPGNPFIERAGEIESRDWKQGDGKKPEKVTYVFRGKRVTYDMPLDALLAPEDPDDCPFPDPSPRLLFPVGPSSPTTNSNNPVPVTPPSVKPPSSFLNALRSTAAATKSEGIPNQTLGLPPTPVTERRISKKQTETRFDPHKRTTAK